MGNILVGQYIPGNSRIHRLDPRTKILLTVCWIVQIFLTNSVQGFGIDILFLFTVILLAQVPVRTAFNSLKPILPIILFTSFFNMFYNGGTVLWSWEFLHITQQGLQNALFLVLRIALMIIGSALLTFTTSLNSLTNGLEKLLAPADKLGVKVSDIAMAITLAIRFISIFSEEFNKIKDAQKARGAHFDSKKIGDRICSILPIILPLIYSAFRRAFDLTNAIESRCYNHQIKRTKLNPLQFKNPDGVSGLLFLAVCILTLFLRQ